MRRTLAAVALTVTVGGCSFLAIDQPGQVQADGSVLINSGELDGAAWRAVAVLRGNEICIVYLGGPIHLSGTCTEPSAGLGAMSAGSGDDYVQTDGFTGRETAVVRVETQLGDVELRPVALDALGLAGGAFALVMPKNARLRRVVMLDANGRPWDSLEMGPVGP